MTMASALPKVMPDFTVLWTMAVFFYSIKISLLPVSETPHIIHIVPPVLPIKSPILWGPGFYLSDQAKPVRSKVSHCETLVRASRRGAPLAPGELAPARSVLYSSQLCRSLANRTDCRTNPDRSTIPQHPLQKIQN